MLGDVDDVDEQKNGTASREIGSEMGGRGGRGSRRAGCRLLTHGNNILAGYLPAGERKSGKNMDGKNMSAIDAFVVRLPP